MYQFKLFLFNNSHRISQKGSAPPVTEGVGVGNPGTAPPVTPGSSGIAESNIPGSAPATASVMLLCCCFFSTDQLEHLY